MLSHYLVQGVPKNRTNKTNKNGQTRQACQYSKVVQQGPKGAEMVNLDVFDHFGPFWARLDHFKQKNITTNSMPTRLVTHQRSRLAGRLQHHH